MCYLCGRRKPRAQLKHITANGQTNAILPQVNCIRTTERDVVNQNDATRELFHVSNFPNVEPPSNVGDFALAFGRFGLRHADEAGRVVHRALQCELSFCFPGLALLPLLHPRVPAVLCEPLDVVCHGLSCISAERFPGRAINTSQITKHRTCLFTIHPTTHQMPLRASQAAPSFCTDSSAVSISEQVRLPMIASTKNRGSEVALELSRFDLSCGGADVKVQRA